MGSSPLKAIVVLVFSTKNSRTSLTCSFDRFICSNVNLLIKNNSNNFFRNFKKKIIELHIAHNDGCYYIDSNGLKELEENNQIALQYCDKEGNILENYNPNGSLKNIAGIYNKKQNVLGMMPHPERMIDVFLTGEDGSLFFKNLLSKK